MDRKLIAGFVAFVLACVVLAFLAGIFAAIFRIFPYPNVQAVVSEISATLKDGSTSDDRHFLHAPRGSDAGVTVYDVSKTQPGITLLTGLWNDDADWHPEVRLINLQGDVLHRWQIYPEKIWPESPHEDWVTGAHNRPNNYVHGVALLPDGDIIFNIEYLGMVRMNACGDIKWRLPYRSHHSVVVDDDGNFWASGLYWREESIEEYVHLQPPFVEETLVKVSPEGEILREISVIDALYKSGYQGVLQSSKRIYDITHMNDVEVLSAELADQFPMFRAGDIMVSLRNYNMVLVVDGETEQVKWHFRHPLIHQHDPDFEPDGSIVIFDNNDDTTKDGSLWGSTQLLRVDPATKNYTRIYPVTDERVLYTQQGGKHQLLPNGNRLITEAMAGRVLEVDGAGNIVWNWVTAARDVDTGDLPEVLEGSRYPAEMVAFTSSLSCQ